MSRRSRPFTGISLLWCGGYPNRMTYPRIGFGPPPASLRSTPFKGANPAARPELVEGRFRGIETSRLWRAGLKGAHI